MKRAGSVLLLVSLVLAPHAGAQNGGNHGVDRDLDGIADVADLCPGEPEDRDGWQDDDGCPDADNDGDGVRDVADACPNDPENRNGREDADGCPD